jgi:hypothetical protein
MIAKTSWVKLLNRSRTGVLFLIALAGVLSSCFPSPHGAYYKPFYPDGTATSVRRDCGGQVGPPSVIRIPVEDAVLSVRIDSDRQGALKVALSLETSGRTRLQFSSDVIRLTDPDTDRKWVLQADSLSFMYRRAGQIPSTAPVDFAGKLPTAPGNIQNDLSVSIPFAVEGFSPDVVRVHVPPVMASSGEIRIPPLTWRADREGASVQGYKKSWDWWPYMEEEVKTGRLTVRAGVTGGFHSEWKAGERFRTQGLNGNIMIAFPADMTWRFASDELVFEDAGTGTSRRVNFPYLRDSSSLYADFTAEFCCGTASWTKMFLAAGAELPGKVRVELPALLVNGRTFIIKPITFERSRFEFGVYPFNC